MKKLTLSTLLMGSLFMGCKKGENDPFISLRSRDARLEGEWTLSKMDAKFTDSNWDPATGGEMIYTTTAAFDGTKLTVVSTDTSVGTGSGSITLSIMLNIKDDGTYSIKQTDTYTESGYTGTENYEYNGGTWSWINTTKTKRVFA